MTPEENFNQEIWFVLNKIKTNSFFSDEDGTFEYMIISPSNPSEKAPLPINEMKILKKLCVLKAIKHVNAPDEIEILEEKIASAMNKKIVKYYLKIIQPRFSVLYRKYIRLSPSEFMDDLNPKPLKWNYIDHTLCWGENCKTIAPNKTAVILFLDVFTEISGLGIFTSRQLSEEYDHHCNKKILALDANACIPKYLNKTYKKILPINFAKTVDRCLKEVRDIFGVRKEHFFPIQREGTLEKARWTCYDAERFEHKKSK